MKHQSMTRNRPEMIQHFLIIITALVAFSGCQQAEKPMNVVIFTFDTTRSDALGCYGNRRIKTPALDALASEGFRFTEAESALPITLPSHTTILTGRYPLAHGVRDNGFFLVPQQEKTLAEILGEEGYRCGASIGAFPVMARFGINQGFEYFNEDVSPNSEDELGRLRKAEAKIYFDARRAGRVNEALYPWLDQHADDPFFVWLHYYDVHHPLNAPPPFNQLYADEPYFGELAYADSCFGQFLEHLEKLGVSDRTMIIMTADHGEGRGDHNEDTHSLLNYESTLHVPLIMKIPGLEGGRLISQRVGTVDIVPTILDYLGISGLKGIQGRSLRPLIAGQGPAEAPPYYAETLSPRLTHDWGELRTLYEGHYKYIHGPRPELYDLEADPQELDDLSHRIPERVASMRADLQRFMKEHSSGSAESRMEMDEDTRARLEALGYVDAGGDRSKITEVLRDGGIPPQDRVQDVNLWTRTKDALVHDQPEVAREAVLSLLKQNPQNPVYRESLVTALLKLGEIDKALRELEKIRQVDLGGAVHPMAETLMMAASALAGVGRTDEALHMASECESLHPSGMVLFLKRMLLLQMGRPGEAEAALQRCLEVEPGYVPAQVVHAAELCQSGKLDEGLDILRRVVEKRPFYAPAHYNLGVISVSQSNLDDALSHFRRAVELDPYYLKARYAVIAVLLDLGRPTEAQKALAGLRQAGPGSPEFSHAKKLIEENQ